MSLDPLDQTLKALNALCRALGLYPAGHDQVLRESRRAVEALAAWGRPLRITVVGSESVIEDRSYPAASPTTAALFKGLLRKGCDSARVEAEATGEDLIAWALFLGSPGEGGYEGRGVTAGRSSLASKAPTTDPAAQAALGYLGLLPKTEEALANVAAGRPEGIAQAQEVVRSLAVYLASGNDLLGPIQALKHHDDYTFTHALNVSVLATALGRAVGLAGEPLDALGLAGLCHDLGKQRIPLEVLNKKGRFEPEEKRVMDGHPAEGARILLGFPTGTVHPLVPVVAYQHHMGVDGAGYPKPPCGARPHAASLLAAVADVFDALRTIRPYREAWSEAAACTVLVREAGVGRLHAGYVSALFGILRVLAAGREVGLSDGRKAVVLEPGAADPLKPLVQAEDGALVDLAATAEVRLDSVGEPAC